MTATLVHNLLIPEVIQILENGCKSGWIDAQSESEGAWGILGWIHGDMLLIIYIGIILFSLRYDLIVLKQVQVHFRPKLCAGPGPLKGLLNRTYTTLSSR